jgi:hypothetical protein
MNAATPGSSSRPVRHTQRILGNRRNASKDAAAAAARAAPAEAVATAGPADAMPSSFSSIRRSTTDKRAS